MTISAFSFAVEISQNGYTVDFLETDGSLKIFWSENGVKEPLFSIEDPKSTSFSIFDDGTLYALGSFINFKKTFNSSEDGGVFIWRSKRLIVREEVKLSSPDYVSISFSISNASEEVVESGMKIVFDTIYEGVDRFNISVNGTGKVINDEFEVESLDNLDYCRSGPLGLDGQTVLEIYPLNTIPDRLVFANWSRLNKADFQYRTVEGRNFSNAPYSADDGALMLLYSPREILPGNTLVISLALKAVKAEDIIESSTDNVSVRSNSQSFQDSGSEETVTDEKNDNNQSGLKAGEILFLKNALVKVGQIRDIIESLTNPGMLTDVTLDRLELLIEELEQLNVDESKE